MRLHQARPARGVPGGRFRIAKIRRSRPARSRVVRFDHLAGASSRLPLRQRCPGLTDGRIPETIRASPPSRLQVDAGGEADTGEGALLDGIRARLSYANVMSTVAVFLAVGGGAYAVSGIPDPGGVFHGCVSNKTGVLRVVRSANSCHKATGRGSHRNPGEFAVSWNQRGQAGPQGPTGLQGSQGPSGSNATINASRREET